MLSQLGDLDLLEEIGRGGMGVVYRARQRSLDREVAAKMLPPELASQPHVPERFRSEAKKMARLSHPHIAQVLLVGDEGGLQHFAKRHLGAGSLQDRLRQGSLSAEAARAIAIPVAEALDYAHRHGIVHRDTKPANIMFDEHGRAVVTDSGIAKAAGDSRLTATGVALAPIAMADAGEH